MRIIESFLVRRAIVGHEPTGLHAVFKRLWSDVKSDLKGSTVRSEIAGYKTVVWPSDASFREAVQSRPLYKARITPYFLLQHNESLGGDVPEDVPWVEHVLPEKPSEAWFEDFSESEHMQLKDTLANLIPLSIEMNVDLSNKPYPKKRPSYKDDSMFKSARQFAKSNRVWTPTKIERRASALANWALKRWPY